MPRFYFKPEDGNIELPQSFNEIASTLSREQCVVLLEQVGIACFDYEGIAILREAVAVNLEDGTITEAALTTVQWTRIQS